MHQQIGEIRTSLRINLLRSVALVPFSSVGPEFTSDSQNSRATTGPDRKDLEGVKFYRQLFSVRY